MKAEDKIMQGDGVWPRVYRHKFEMCMFVFMMVGLFATAISAMVPDEDRYAMPAVADGLAWGLGAFVLAIMFYLGWWLWVALFDKDVTK